MHSPKNRFQCFLIIGEATEAQKQSLQIAKNQGIDLDKVSPDIFVIAPLKQSISIDEVRNLKSHIFQKPVNLPVKIVIFRQAHKLTTEAQNALLKILEEPPGQALIILEAENKENILPTIRSRVITKELKKPKTQEADFYLNHNLDDLLGNLPLIEDQQKWLDTQIEIAHGQIVKNAKSSKITPKPITQALDACITAKKMLSANVNPTFVLANLYLQTARKES